MRYRVKCELKDSGTGRILFLYLFVYQRCLPSFAYDVVLVTTDGAGNVYYGILFLLNGFDSWRGN